MKRKINLFLTFLLALCLSVATFASCSLTEERTSKGKASVEKTDTKVIITVNETEGLTYLLDVMNYLKEKNKLAFEIADDGMILSIEGKECDTVTWSPFWFLYTSDAEMANTDWGTVRYNGNVYGSAILGASALEVAAGETYIWYYSGVQTVEVLEATETMAVIKVKNAEGYSHLIDVMSYLKAEKDLDYDISSTGMVLSINGKTPEANAYWMLYTSDTEMSNSEWGTIEYNGTTYASATLGAESLEVIDGGLYIWTIVSFG